MSKRMRWKRKSIESSVKEEESKMNEFRKGLRKSQTANHILCLKLLLFLLGAIQLTEALRFSSLQMPALVQLRSNFWLGCQFELEDWEQLYSVKWYKNNEEFYRQLEAQDQQQQQQQQYFGQAGVNVLMSSSNATHVRLLNASLDTEALYACEISTQNLSTIRYEREIRLYALPHSSRPAIIGSRAGYALNDKVDLVCSSDFARPRPALAWFINGRRITGAEAKWFQLEPARRQDASAGLFAAATTLRFRLTGHLLARLGWPKALRFECALKLAEVSELVYNQLQLGQQQQQQQQLPAGRQKPFRLRRMAGGRLRLSKDAATNRIVQSRSPAGRRDLWLALAWANKTNPACGGGGGGAGTDRATPLWPDDPLVVEVPGAPQLLNCTTAGALEASLAAPKSGAWAPAADASPPLPLPPPAAAYCAEPNSRRKMLISGKYQEQAPTNQRQTPSAGSARRPSAVGPNSLERQRQRAASTVAYLSLSPGQLERLRSAIADSAESSAADHQQQQQQQQQQQWLSAPPLLEWFINNQEAPRSSASYEPELPLVALGARAPSIDYAEYFANFDSRPIHQHLVLNLSSQPPSSRLELRCISTQAQVLAADSSSFTIFVVEEAWTTSHKNNQNQNPNQNPNQRVLQSKQARNSCSRETNPLNPLGFILFVLLLSAVIFNC